MGPDSFFPPALLATFAREPTVGVLQFFLQTQPSADELVDTVIFTRSCGCLDPAPLTLLESREMRGLCVSTGTGFALHSCGWHGARNLFTTAQALMRCSHICDKNK